MRKYTIAAGDTLREIAIRYYKVDDRQGELTGKKVERVIDLLIKRNPQVLDPDRLAEGQTISLPSIWGVPARDPAIINVPWRNIRYFLLWFVPVSIFSVLAITQPVWSFIAGQRLEGLFRELQDTLPFGLFEWGQRYGFGWLFGPLDQPMAGAVRYSIIWSLIVFLLWLYLLPTPERPYLRIRVRYLVLWFGGSVVLIAGLSAAIQAIVPQAASELTILSNIGPLLAVWSTLVLLLFIYIGDGSEVHHLYLGQYQSIWTSLLLVIALIVLASYSAYQDTSERVNGLLAARTLAGGTVTELRNVAEEVERIAGGLAGRIDNYEGYLQFSRSFPMESTSQNSDQPQPDLREMLLDQLSNDFPRLKQYTVGAHTKAQAALTQLDIAIQNEQSEPGGQSAERERSSGTSLAQTRQVISETVAVTGGLPPLVDAVEAEIDELRKDPQRPFTNLKTILRSDLIVQADEAGDQARVASRTIKAVEVAVLATFLWVSGFYTIFVLFPWILLFLFLFRKREDRAAQIYDDLKLLDPDENLLHRVLPTEPEERLKKKTVIINDLASQAFSNFEYILSLLLLSVITAIAWYYVFYPKTSLGLAVLIQGGGEIKELTTYLVDNISPLTSGFIGAFFYIMQMLYRRYRDTDLYPMAFLQASERLLRVFILSLVLSIMAPLAEWLSGTAILVAFVAGIYPRAALRRIVDFVNINTNGRFPQITETARLTHLGGLNIWHEARLLDEGVENIESMADAPIEHLVLKTHFPTNQLVDWIDQATLYKHAGHRGEWFPLFRAAGIRTASDLLDRAGLSLLDPDDLRKLRTDSFTPAPQTLDRVAAAVNAAQVWAESNLNGTDGIARALAATLLQSVVNVAEIAAQAHILAKRIEKEKPETYDYVFALNQSAVAALEATREASTSLTPMTGPDLNQQWPADADQISRAKRAVAKIGQSMGKAVTLAEQVVQLTQPLTRQPDTLTQLDKVKKQVDDWLTELTTTGTQIQVLIDIFTAAGEVAETKTAATGVLEQATAARAVLTTAQEATMRARDTAQPLDAGHPETLDAIQKLQIDLAQLQTLAGKLVDDRAELNKAVQALILNDAQKAEVTLALDKAAKTVEKLKKAALQARDATQPLLADDVSTLEGLGQSQAAIDQAQEVVQETRPTVEAAVALVQSVTVTPQLTAYVLESIVDCLWPENNMPYVVNYYYQTGQRLNIPGSSRRQTRRKRG
jgi:type VII secretion effector (TIGR04197 family)